MFLTLTPLSDFGVATLPPDIVWQTADGLAAGTCYGVKGDFAVALVASDGPDGLVSKNPLLTAVIALLFSDCRVEDYEANGGRNSDLRGWPGDGFDVDTAAGEQALGSKLWLLRRMDLNAQTGFWAQAEAKRALQPLVAQGVVVRIDAVAAPDFENDLMALAIDAYGRDGSRVFSQKFDLLWKLATGGV